MNVWETFAGQAALAYKEGQQFRDFPPPGAVGECEHANRALYEACMGKPYPYRANTALETMRNALAARAAYIGYHQAAAADRIVTGAALFFGGDDGDGHVVVVVDVRGDPNTDTSGITIFENTAREVDGKALGT